jgi:hypothetical protein
VILAQKKIGNTDLIFDKGVDSPAITRSARSKDVITAVLSFPPLTKFIAASILGPMFPTGDCTAQDIFLFLRSNKRFELVVWCGRWDLNPRTPKGQELCQSRNSSPREFSAIILSLAGQHFHDNYNANHLRL